MCGVFGFVSRGNDGPDLDTLQRIATVTQRRGPHAWGMAWIDSKGRLKMYKQSGRVSDHLGLLAALAADARMLIGHCRYATHGDPGNNLNNHPHPADGGWFVHNGMIHDYLDVAAREDLHPVTDCDSEILGQLVEQGSGSLMERCVEAVLNVRKTPLVMLGLWNRPERLVVVRQGNPLHQGRAKAGYYLASLAEGLPGKVGAIKDETAREFGPDGIDKTWF